MRYCRCWFCDSHRKQLGGRLRSRALGFNVIKACPVHIPLEHSKPHPSPSQTCLQSSASHVISLHFSAQFWTTAPLPLACNPQCPFSHCWLHLDVTVQFTREQFPRQVCVQSPLEQCSESHPPVRQRWKQFEELQLKEAQGSTTHTWSHLEYADSLALPQMNGHFPDRQI